MKKLLLSSLISIAVIAAAIVVALPATGDQFRSQDPTPTLTADQVSELSERRNLEDIATNQKIAEDLIASGESVVGIPKSEIAAIANPPLALDTILASADAVIAGRIKDQFLAHLPGRGSDVFIVSVLTAEDGKETGRLYQRTGIGRPAGTIVLGFYGSEGLTQGQRYAAPCVGTPDACVAIFGHLYEMDAQGALSPLAGFARNPMIEGKSIDALTARWAAARAAE